ncbi:AbrB/MazE/SpoVT family DNA-binding domain-containing protein [Candidatus Magnetomoraceae bacterium gMMP-15]
METVKTISNGGQISLGKEYAGRHVLIEDIKPGVWIVKLGHFIPDSEQWLYEPTVKSQLDEAIHWAEKNPPQSSDLNEIENKLKL